MGDETRPTKCSPLPASRSSLPAPSFPLLPPRSLLPAPPSPLPAPRSPLPAPRSPLPTPRSALPAPHRIGFLTTHPIQYQAPVFRLLHQRPEIDLTVLFCQIPNEAQQGDGFGVGFQWDIPLLEGYQYTVLHNRAARPSVTKFSGCDTPDVAGELKARRLEALIVNGWVVKSCLQGLRACRRLGVPCLVRGEANMLRPRPWWKRLLHRALVRQYADTNTPQRLPPRESPGRFAPCWTEIQWSERMLELYWYSFVAASSVFAFANWRRGLYAVILIDALRDPVRKLVEGQPVLITVSGVAVWGALIAAVFFSQREQLQRMFRRYPQLVRVATLVFLALVPAAMISAVSYPGGWKLAVLGFASYLLPIVGLGVGFVFATSERSLYRVLGFYAIVHGVVLASSLFEYLGFESAVLGGMHMDWIRYVSGYQVELIAGCYRSPDIMGIHAVHVFMFSLLLALRARGARRMGWVCMVLWAALSVVLGDGASFLISHQQFSGEQFAVLKQVLEREDLARIQFVALPSRDFDESNWWTSRTGVKEFFKSLPTDRVAVVTNGYHTRRARWMFRQVLGPLFKQVSFVSAPWDMFPQERWWQHPGGLTIVAGEYLKLGFYVMYYGHGAYWLGGVLGSLALWYAYRRRYEIRIERDGSRRGFRGGFYESTALHETNRRNVEE